MKSYILVLLFLVSVAALVYAKNGACNEATCVSLVSKCMLIKCCECDMTNLKNCTCCHECQLCLAHKYSECCACVGMCQPGDDTAIYKTSSIENLNDPIPDLFKILTAEEDALSRWTINSYPSHFDSLYFLPEKRTGLENTIAIDSGDKKSEVKMKMMEVLENTTMENCTTAFMSTCLTIRDCKKSCISMGAAKYRWFHDYGCCQCIGDTCVDYGLSEPGCSKCPLPEEDEVSMYETHLEEEGDS